MMTWATAKNPGWSVAFPVARGNEATAFNLMANHRHLSLPD